MKSPISKAASALGKLAAGKPKRFSPEELKKRTARLADARKKKAEMRARR